MKRTGKNHFLSSDKMMHLKMISAFRRANLGDICLQAIHERQMWRESELFWKLDLPWQKTWPWKLLPGRGNPNTAPRELWVFSNVFVKHCLWSAKRVLGVSHAWGRARGISVIRTACSYHLGEAVGRRVARFCLTSVEPKWFVASRDRAMTCLASPLPGKYRPSYNWSQTWWVWCRLIFSRFWPDIKHWAAALKLNEQSASLPLLITERNTLIQRRFSSLALSFHLFGFVTI